MKIHCLASSVSEVRRARALADRLGASLAPVACPGLAVVSYGADLPLCLVPLRQSAHELLASGLDADEAASVIEAEIVAFGNFEAVGGESH